MTWHRALPIALLVALACPLPAAAAPPELQQLWRISFDGAATPEPAGATVTGADALLYVEGKCGQAADFSEGRCVEYTGLAPLPSAAGTLELWVKPLHDRKDLNDHHYLRFSRADGSPVVDVSFTQVEMSAEVVIKTGGRKFRRYGWGWAQGIWQHVAITWDTAGPSPSGLILYISGQETGYPATCQALEETTGLRVGCRSLEEGVWAKAWLDEIAVYNRCLTHGQVKALCQRGGLNAAEKLSQMAALIAAEDARLAQEREKLFATKLGILHGRNTSLLNWPDGVFAGIDIPVPTPVHEDSLAQTDLSAYAALICPGGGGLNLTPENREALLGYVKGGGGYVGICGGLCSALQYGLLEAEKYRFNVRGPVWVKLKEHPVTAGYDLSRMVLFPHASGPLMVPKGEGQETIGTFDVGGEPLPEFTHTLSRRLGQGRVVGFSGHPEGSADTRPMLRNAVLWTAKITDPPTQPLP